MRRTLLPLLTLCLAMPVGCSRNTRIGAEKAVAKALVSDEQEAQIGKQVHDELVKQGARFVEDPEITGYVETLAKKVIDKAKNERPGVNWKIYVIDDPKTVNAFVTPGGRMYVYTGLLLTAENEAEVMGVLSHETGHVVARHIARQMVNQFGLQAIVGLAVGQNPTLLEQIGASVVGQGTLLAFSRGDETEADELGARYAHAVGYTPEGLVTFFQKLLKQSGKSPKLLSWLSTHPATEDRIAHLREYIQTKNLDGGTLGGKGLAQIKQRLQTGSTAAGSH